VRPGDARYHYTKEFPNHECVPCYDNNCIEGYDYDCEWDNYHYLKRCRPKGGFTEWINKNFTNETGHNRNDVDWEFEDAIAHKIVRIISPPKLGHVEIAGTGSGANKITKVRWADWSQPDVWGDGVPPKGRVNCCVKINWRTEAEKKGWKRDPYWTLNGDEMETVAGCASVTYTTVSEDSIGILLGNTANPDDPALYVDEFAYALVDEPLELPELTWDNPAIDWVTMPWYGTIPPLGSIHLGTIPDASPGDYLITQVGVNFISDPPSHKGHIVVQSQWLATSPIPTLTEWGMIIFGVVLLGFISWVFLRRRKAVVSLR
jgi:hypothetical protein